MNKEVDGYTYDDVERIGKGLEVGEVLRPQDNHAMLIQRKPDGIRAFSFRTRESLWVPIQEPLEQRLKRLRDAMAMDVAVSMENATAGDLVLPKPIEPDPQDWPSHARLWFYRAGFSNDDIIHLGAYWNPRWQRVVLPVYDRGYLVYWQARRTAKNDDRFKYVNPKVNRRAIVARYAPVEPSPLIVLTEDILSAAKVGRQYEAWSLMGTYMSDVVAARLLQENRPVLVSLDPDDPGQEAALEIHKQLALYNIRSAGATMPRDPKECNRKEIESCITKALSRAGLSELPQH